MAFAVNNGAWRIAKNVSVHNGAWRTAKAVWVNVGGTWRQAWFSNGVLSVGETGSAGSRAWGLDPDVGGGIGSLTPATNYSGVYTFTTVSHYELGARTTLRITAASTAGITKTNLIKSIYVPGGGELLTANVLDGNFFNTGTMCGWQWAGADTLGFQAASGSTMQIQTLAA